MSGIIANTSDVSWVAESGDCINRQDAINVAIQAADDWDGGYNPERAEMIERGLEMLPALQAESCEDAISREDALMALTGEWTELTDELIHQFIRRIKNLPSVTPQPKIGHWINLEKTKYKGQVLPFWCRYGCSKCGGYGEGTFNFCPNCGSYNGGYKNETDN